MALNILNESEVAGRKTYKHTPDFMDKSIKIKKIRDGRTKALSDKIVTINSLTITVRKIDSGIINV